MGRAAHDFRPEATVSHCHLVHYYRPGPTEATAAGEFLALGVADGAAILLLTTRERVRAITQDLAGRGVDLDALVAAGRAYVSDASAAAAELRQGDPAAVFTRYAVNPAVRLREQHGTVRCYGELVDVLTDDRRFEAALTLEGLWNDFLESEPKIQLLCGYDTSRFQAPHAEDALSRVARCHFDVIGGLENLADADEEALLRRFAQLEILLAAARVESLGVARVEVELEDTKRRLVELGKFNALGEICAGLAHELNNPLSIIDGSVRIAQELLLQQAAPDPQILRRLEVTKKACDRMNRLIQGVLSFGRGRSEAVGKCSLADAVTNVLALTADEVEHASIAVTSAVPAGPEAMVHGTSSTIEQVLLNLINNARDAIGKKPGGRVTLELRRRDLVVELLVTDNGEGMDEETRKSVFLPFFTMKPVGQGSGLGLYISLSLVRGLGGEIVCRSERGVGTTMTLILPAA